MPESGPYRQVNLQTLAEIDSGKGAEAFHHLLKLAAADCIDRPGDSSKRKVSLEIVMSPVMDQDGDCSEVRTTIRAKSSLPAYQTKEYSMAPRKGGMLIINLDSPGNINQNTFDMGDE